MFTRFADLRRASAFQKTRGGRIGAPFGMATATANAGTATHSPASPNAVYFSGAVANFNAAAATGKAPPFVTIRMRAVVISDAAKTVVAIAPLSAFR